MRNLVPSLLLAALCASSASADIFRPSVKDQIKLGKQAKAQITKDEKVLPDSDPRSKELTRLGNELVSLIPSEERQKRPFEYEFHVVNSKEINAFAVPGGPIYFYTGLLDKLTTEDQVAGILAHEITHIRNQHWASAYADNMKRRMGLTVVLSLLKAGDTWYTIADLTDTFFVGLPYSRKHENEADKVGFDLAVRAGHNPTGMIDVMKILKAENKSKVQEWMSTHPDTDKRIKNLEEMAAQSSHSTKPQKPRDPSVLPKKA